MPPIQPSSDTSLRDLRTAAGIASGAVLMLHYYYYCHLPLQLRGLTASIPDRFVSGLAQKGLFKSPAITLTLALVCLAATLLGTNTNAKSTKPAKLLTNLAIAAALYYGAPKILPLNIPPDTRAALYIATTTIGLTLLYNTLKSLIGKITWPSKRALFNAYNESFPQHETEIHHPHILTLQGKYQFQGVERYNVINLDVRRGLLVLGSPGSGKTRYVFRQLIPQSIQSGAALFVYDLKYDGLTRFTRTTLEKADLKNPPKFYSFNFDDLATAHRCNVLDPGRMEDLSDAAECARTLLYAMNRDAARQKGKFFTESAINFFTACIWFLRLYNDGAYCTLPHLIELMATDYPKLFTILRSYPDLLTLVHPLVEAYLEGVMEQLQGQLDSARIILNALISPKIYYLLSASDFDLEINNPKAPKILCVGSDPRKQNVYSIVIALLYSRLLKAVNHPGGVPCHIYTDEFASFHALGIETALATSREQGVGIILGLQTIEQLRTEYGRDQADALFNLPASLLSSQVFGDGARLVSDRVGRILQERAAISTNSRDTSTSQSYHLDPALPASKIATLSSGEFVGITADSPDAPVNLKAVHCRITLTKETLAAEAAEAADKRKTADTGNAPKAPLAPDILNTAFLQVKDDVSRLVDTRIHEMKSSPDLARLVIRDRSLDRGRKPRPD